MYYLNNWIPQVRVLTVDFLTINVIQRQSQIKKEPELYTVKPSGVDIVDFT